MSFWNDGFWGDGGGADKIVDWIFKLAFVALVVYVLYIVWDIN